MTRIRIENESGRCGCVRMVIPFISYNRSEIRYLLKGVWIGVTIGELVCSHSFGNTRHIRRHLRMYLSIFS